MKKCTFIILLVLGISVAELELPTSFLPTSLLPTSLLPTSVASLDQAPQVKERCDKQGKSDTYERLKTAINDTVICLQNSVYPKDLQKELDEAKKTGSMDEVFGKYCKERSNYKECILKTVNVAKECLEEAEISALESVNKILEEIGDFACYRDGDRLAMFVAEGGPDCVQSRTAQIKKCINSTLSFDTDNLNINDVSSKLPSLNLKVDKENCDKLAQLQQCIVDDMETNCKDTTPANILDAMFKFIKKAACKNVSKRDTRSRNKKYL